jgi:NAD(P)-dependent dehydrogenase (short-subunit alcohol dehydrogenase family)
VYATARDPAKAKDLQLVANLGNGRVQIVSADANDINSLHLAAINIKESFNALDVVIYNAGVLKGFGNILEVGIDSLKDNINTNLYGAYYAAVEFTPLLLRSKYSKKTLVFLTSEFAVRPSLRSKSIYRIQAIAQTKLCVP